VQTIQLHTKAGRDGQLRLQIPVGMADAEYDVVVVLQPKAPPDEVSTPAERGWPAGFFEQTAGSITDPTFRRHEEPGYEQRLDLE
jgi:hypothetical protein